MKLNTKVNSIERSADFEQSNYTIEATAKAFSILSDQLYSNKVRAVIRELSTNAYDSHVDAENDDTPFEVHLPSNMEPTFSVRDYGTGLSHSDCMHLYTTYFRSNRTDSNDAVGCMGLGSKSPFAYSDSFTVESFFNGEHRTYNAYKNEEDEPVFALLNTQATSEPNGLKVSFPVKSEGYDNDVQDFQNEAEDLYKWFKVAPKITGQSIEIVPESYIIEGDGWAVRKIDRNADYHAVAVMGQVAYPIDNDNFDDNKEINQILRTNITIKFDIGELSVTPSRESLSYNKHTKNAIVKKCLEVKENAQQVAEESISEANTLWDARVAHVNLTRRNGLLGGLSSVIDSAEIKWNDTDLFDNQYSQVYIGDIEGLTVRVYYRDGWKKTVQTDSVFKLLVDPNAAIFVDDLTRGGIGRIKHKVRESTSSGRYEHGDSKFKIYRVSGTVEAIDKFRELVGCDESHFNKTSDLDKPVSNRHYEGEKRTSIAKWNGQCRGWKKGQNWDDASVDLNDGGYFVEISRYEIQSGHGAMTDLGTLSDIIKHLNILGHDIDKDKIYGIKTATRRGNKFYKLEHNEGKWIDIFKLASDVADNISEEDKELIQDKMSVRSMFGNLNTEIGDIRRIADKTTTANGLKQIIVLHDHIKKQQEEHKVDDLYSLCRMYNALPKKVDNKHQPHIKACLDKYPLVGLVTDRYCSIDKELIPELARYVDLIERENNA